MPLEAAVASAASARSSLRDRARSEIMDAFREKSRSADVVLLYGSVMHAVSVINAFSAEPFNVRLDDTLSAIAAK
jgi:hypothetical protein